CWTVQLPDQSASHIRPHTFSPHRSVVFAPLAHVQRSCERTGAGSSQRRPEPFDCVHVYLPDAVSIVIARSLPSAVADRLARAREPVVPLPRTGVDAEREVRHLADPDVERPEAGRDLAPVAALLARKAQAAT